jgi:hypothetical protein
MGITASTDNLRLASIAGVTEGESSGFGLMR